MLKISCYLSHTHFLYFLHILEGAGPWGLGRLRRPLKVYQEYAKYIKLLWKSYEILYISVFSIYFAYCGHICQNDFSLYRVLMNNLSHLALPIGSTLQLGGKCFVSGTTVSRMHSPKRAGRRNPQHCNIKSHQVVCHRTLQKWTIKSDQVACQRTTPRHI